MENKNEKLEMLDLNQPSTNGVGIFFAVCRTAIGSCSWARKDFQAVQLVEGQLAYLEKYCKQHFGQEPSINEKPAEIATEKEVVEKQPNTQPEKKDAAEKLVEPQTPSDEVVDPTDKGEKRKVQMPDSILEKVIEGVQASKNFQQNPPRDPVQEIPLPSSKDEYEQVF
jgi:hypothetical protein